MVGALAVSSAGCGSKSGLLALGAGEPTPASGGGGAAAGSGGASSGGGASASGSGGSGALGGGGPGGMSGTGGGVAICPTLALEGVRGFDGLQKTHESEPSLVVSSDDGARATLMFRWESLEPAPIELHAKLGHLSFDAWAAWPEASLGQAWVAVSYGTGTSHALGDAPGEAHAFLYYDDASLSGTEGMFFAPSAVPKASFEKLSLGSIGQRALFVTRGDGDHLIGFERSFAGHHALAFGRFAAGEPSFDQSSGCGTAPISADAARVPGAYLIALSSSRPLGSCQDDFGVDGPPIRLELARLADGAASPALGALIDSGSPIRQLRLLRASQGTWLVWQYGGGVQPSPVLAVRVDDAGQLASPIFSVAPDGSVFDGFSATTLGDRLVIAYTDAFDPSVSKIVLRAIDSSGVLVTEHALEPPAELWPKPPYALQGSPGADALLLAWTAASAQWRVKIARFACVDSS
jgi:hypothetical protein